MTDREKLIELLTEPISVVESPLGDECAPKMKIGLIYAGNVADHLLANGVTFQKWIPVSERLPDLGGIYLVVVKYKYDFEKEFTYDTDVATFHFGYDHKYIDGQWNTYVDWDEGQQYIHVTHWLPLPEPPKEGQ